jgi:predicted nucleotidyltransferase
MDQIPLPQDFRDLLKLLRVHGVRYLLIGGWAVGFHGYPRNTADIDIWIAGDPENAKATAKMLHEFIGIAPPADDFLKVPVIVRMGNPPNRVEISTAISGVEFEGCYARRVEAVLQGVAVSLIGLKDLMTNKRASGRDKDITDAKALDRYHKIAGRKKKK